MSVIYQSLAVLSVYGDNTALDGPVFAGLLDIDVNNFREITVYLQVVFLHTETENKGRV